MNECPTFHLFPYNLDQQGDENIFWYSLKRKDSSLQQKEMQFS